MTKRGVRIAYGSKTIEKRSENGQSKASARCLTYAGQSPRTQTRPLIRRPIPMYVGSSEHTCVHKNRAAYT